MWAWCAPAARPPGLSSPRSLVLALSRLNESSSSRSPPPSLLLSETLAQPVRQARVLKAPSGLAPTPPSPTPTSLENQAAVVWAFFLLLLLSRGGSGAGDKPSLEETPQRCRWQGKPPWTLDRLRGKKPRLRVGDRALFGENGKEGRALRRNPLLRSAGGSAMLLPGLVPEGQDQIQQGAQEMAKN